VVEVHSSSIQPVVCNFLDSFVSLVVVTRSHHEVEQKVIAHCAQLQQVLVDHSTADW